jgi:hypothetical protein
MMARGEQVAENPLRRQTDGDAADAQTRDKAGDVHAQIVEHHDQRDGEAAPP